MRSMPAARAARDVAVVGGEELGDVAALELVDHRLASLCRVSMSMVKVRWRSLPGRAPPSSGEPGSSPALLRGRVRRGAFVLVGGSARNTARSITLRSSRTLPGQS